MAHELQTVPTSLATLPVRTLLARVVKGPDEGAQAVAAGETLSIGTAEGNDLVLTDSTVSRYHVALSIHARGVQVCDHGSTNGTLCGAARLERAVVPSGTTLALGRSQVWLGDGGEISVELHQGTSLGKLCGQSPLMRRLMAKVERLAQTHVSVLLLGESGTGKELVAEALHELGPRQRGPFVTVDCGALTPTLVASELFGHERGAFTGATRQHIGAFERAAGGTILLDEIGELPPELQTTLLGVLERRQIKRVGGDRDIPIDVRVVSATHNDLRAAVNRGTFRLDLYYRVATVMLELPPLRERAADIPLLVEYFLREAGWTGRLDELVSAEAMRALERHPWTGNVRELRNFVEAAVAMGEAPAPESLSTAPPTAAAELSAEELELTYGEARTRVLDRFERQYLAHLLARSRDNVSLAARLGQMDRSNLIRLLKRHGLR